MKCKKKQINIFLLVAGKQILISVDDQILLSLLQKKLHICNNLSPNPSCQIILKKQKSSSQVLFIKKPKKNRTIQIVYPQKYSFKNLYFAIIAYIQYLLFSSDILFFHASSAVLKDYGLVFLGHSGIGKTTITSMFSNTNIYSDDIAVIRREDNKYFIYSSPFDKDRGTIFSFRKTELKYFCLLKKGTRNRVSRISSSTFFTKIITDKIIFNYLLYLTKLENKREIFCTIVRNIKKLLSNTNHYQLTKTKNSNVILKNNKLGLAFLNKKRTNI
jgi:hypothetical protein